MDAINCPLPLRQNSHAYKIRKSNGQFDGVGVVTFSGKIRDFTARDSSNFVRVVQRAVLKSGREILATITLAKFSIRCNAV